MTEAKKKANELVEMFYESLSTEATKAVSEADAFVQDEARKCALIYVEGIIQELIIIHSRIPEGVSKRIILWQQVKTEIQNETAEENE